VLNQFDEMPNLVKHNNGTAPSVMFDPSQGSPSPGSLVVQAPFFAANQYVDVQKSFGTSTPIDLSGRTLYVRVKVTQGTFPGGAQVYVNTTSGYVFGGTFTNAGRNSNWQEFKMDVNNPMTKGMPSANYDPTHVVQIGVQLNNGTGATNASPVTFNIDSFSVDPPLPGSTTDGGGGAAGGSGGATGDGAASDGTSN
jgi:hypothetical protein